MALAKVVLPEPLPPAIPTTMTFPESVTLPSTGLIEDTKPNERFASLVSGRPLCLLLSPENLTPESR